ncbi:hypothetical protein C9374_001827 [Naegleria lovaniensis]|uniref:F-box domain-containing protein n=1 Tax=Naegleria lovaniensis TaxID=51637 RepID=A0AA88GTK2_NAELO|nr:uncharacterized protein C9374_001827 [Naegleria lovaniensis]KAG2386792.1 hypothetical protein C9374_001827 [Naegleria lovaniensis]
MNSEHEMDILQKKISSPSSTNTLLPVRLGHSALFYNQHIYFFGGLQKTVSSIRPLEFVDDLVQVHSLTHEITNLTSSRHPNEGPCARNFHTTVLNTSSNEMILFGGKSNGFLNDVWSFNFATGSWRRLDCENSQLITPRYGHSSVIYGDSMFVFGGYDNNAFTSKELFELNLKTFEWKSVGLKLSNAKEGVEQEVSGRFYHASALDEENGDWYLIGGKSSNGLTKDFIKIKLSTLSTVPVTSSDNDNKDSKSVEFEFIESSDENVLRYGHSCILEKIGNQKKIYMMGGCNQQVDFFDCYCLELNDASHPSLWKKVNANEHVLAQLFKEPSKSTSNESTQFEAFPVFHTITRYVNVNDQSISYFVFGGTLQKTQVETTSTKQNAVEIVSTTNNAKKQVEEMELHYKEFEDMLNDDIFRKILSYLQCVDLMRLQLVSKRLRICQLTTEDQYWKDYYMKKISDLRQATAIYYYDTSARQMLWRNDSQYDHLPNRSENFKQGLIEVFKTFITKAEKSSKQLTSDLERLSFVAPKRRFFTPDEILAYPNEDINFGSPKDFKCVTIGDGATGKTSMLITYTTKTFPVDYVPTVFDNYSHPSTFMPNMNLGLWDTAGPEDYDRLRPLSYPCTDLFLLCFSIVSKASLLNISTKWIPEVSHYCPDCPVLLIGTKKDLRTDPVHTKSMLMKYSEKPVTKEQGELMARKMGCISYIETSSKLGEGFERFDELIIKAVSVGKDGNYQPFSNHSKKKCYLQ